MNKFIVHIVNNTCFVLIGLLLFAGSCKKSNDNKQLYSIDSVIHDIDGNAYKTVKIGNQYWMAENLKVTHYQNGESLVSISTDNSRWAKCDSGAYCLYQNDTLTKLKRGCLYNWYATSDQRKIAPKGWHIPSDNEWKELENYLGMNILDVDKIGFRGQDQANMLKCKPEDTTKRDGWYDLSDGNDHNRLLIHGNNQSGFNALSNNCRLHNGWWSDAGYYSYYGFWWTASEGDSAKTAWYRYLDYYNVGVFRYYSSKFNGYSIRCVRD